MFNVVAWDKVAELCGNYTTKGQKIYVEGRLQTRTWDGQDGQKHKSIDLVARDVVFLGSRTKTSGPDEEQAAPPPGGGEIEPNDLPF